MEGIYVWVITAMLSYGSAGVIAYDKEVTELIFEDDGENLTGFDFLCETRFIQTEEV
jgi:hypothetical protein